MRNPRRGLVWLGLAIGSWTAGCEPPVPRVLTPSGFTRPSWSAADLEKEIAVKTLRATPHASYHLVRLAGSEVPHIHGSSDLQVFVLEGKVRMTLGQQRVHVEAGDVIDIPKGVPHFAENVSDGPSLAYTVFSPPFDKVDVEVVDPESR